MSRTIQDRFTLLNGRIKAACRNCNRNPEEISLIAVSKTKPDEDVRALMDAGQVHFGENRVQALTKRFETLNDPAVQWHFIGTLQTNKIKYMAHRVNWIQSVHKSKALVEIDRRALEAGRVINTLIQVNISQEDQKSGCEPEELPGLLKQAQQMKHLRVLGLMGMATFTDDPEKVRPEFRILRSLRDEHLFMNEGSVNLKHLSMGMTNDLEVAVEEGSTMLRVGTAIFGSRNYG
ncbi:MAG: YggS family pyridoxal phosphate-dependent enzyme [Balneolaceae bacterium]|nr:MAG: YggS family pyridoxal phosphate-dependent enzyme [Balneolaceae bacterium]